MRWPSLLVLLALPALLAGTAAAGTGCGGGDAEPAPGLELTITISEGAVEAVPTESAPGIAALHGNVTVQMPSLRGATVTLTSSTDIGWVSTIEPQTMVLDNGQVGEFSVNVVVPQGSPASQIGTLMVYGRAVASGLQVTAEDTAAITVRPYYRIFVEAQKREVEITPGGTAHFTLRITNAGNSIDSFGFQVTNQKELEKRGWKLAITTTNLDRVEPAEYRTVGIALSAPASISPYTSQSTSVGIRAYSMGAREHNLTVELNTALSVKEVGVSGPGLGVVAIVAVAAAAGAVFYWRRRRRALNDAGARAPAEPPKDGA